MSEEFENENVVYENLGRIMGLNAYELARRAGYPGTETEWLESLKSKVLNITKTTSGNTNTYTMTFSNGNTQTFTVDNGKEISSITKQSSTATESTLLITFNDSTTETVTIPNGTGISSVSKIDTNGLVDTYQINYTDKDPTVFTVTNGVGITNIAKTDTDGHEDTYTIYYSNGTTSTFKVMNGEGSLVTNYSFRRGYYVKYKNGVGETINPYTSGGRSEHSDFEYAVIPVNAGDWFVFTAKGGNNGRTYAVLDSDNVVVKGETTANKLRTNFYVEVEEDGTLVVNNNHTECSTAYVKKINLFSALETKKLIESSIDALPDIPTTQEIVSAVIEALPNAEEATF